MSVFEKFLTTLKNANLTAYDRKISGVGVKVTVFFNLGLDRIELPQIRFEIPHILP